MVELGSAGPSFFRFRNGEGRYDTGIKKQAGGSRPLGRGTREGGT